MAGVRFAHLFTASCFGVLLLAASASASSSRRPPPQVYIVGDETGRAGGTQTLSKWVMSQRFYVGDVLDFKQCNDTVLLVRQGDYERCSAGAASPPAHRFFADGGDARFTLARPGLFYFISGAPARCEAGQRMVVRAVDSLIINGGAPTPSPSPAPAADDGGLSMRRRPLSVAQKQMVVGALGFAAGFVAMFLAVGLAICFCA